MAKKTSADKLRYCVLGPLEVHRRGERVKLGDARDSALLVLLLLRPTNCMSAEHLIRQLWSQPPSSARNALQGSVSRLRRALGEERILCLGSAYRLELGADIFDLHRLSELQALATRRREEGRREESVALLDKALALWRGPALANLSRSSSITAAANLLDERYFDCLTEKFELKLELGCGGNLVPDLRTLTYAHPEHERLRAALMLALYRDGRQADALREYQDTRAYLDDSYGILPTEGLRSLHQAILRQDPCLERDAGPYPWPGRSLASLQLEPEPAARAHT